MLARARPIAAALVLGLAGALALDVLAVSLPAARPDAPEPTPTASAVSPTATASATPVEPSRPLAAGPTAGPTAPVAFSIAPYRPLIPSATADIRAALSAELAAQVTRSRIPGASVAIVFPDGTVWTGVAGLADVAAGDRVTSATGFSYASISKTFTAAAVLALVEDGRLDLEASAAGIIPEHVSDLRISIRMLLDHTSGLHDFFLDRPIDTELQNSPGLAWSAARSLAHVKQPYFPPGTGWHYSNTNYLLLGLIAERVTGEPLATLIRQRFLDPLELASISYQGVEPPRTALAHGHRVGASGPPADLGDGSPIVPFTSVVTASGAAGSLAGSAIDAARWARALYRGDVLEPASLAAMVAGAATNAARRGGQPYGLGVQAYPVLGRPALGHSGRFLGFQGAVRYFPGDGLTIAVLTNQSRTDPATLVRALVALAAPEPAPCSACPERH